MMHDTLEAWELAALKSASRLLIQRLGKFEAAALVAGRSPGVLHGYQDLSAPAFMPVDVVLRLERALVEMGGEPILTPLLARKLGMLCVTLPRASGEIPREVAGLMRQAAEVAARHAEAMADGRLTEAEEAHMAEAAQQVHALSAQLLALLAARRPATAEGGVDG